jgi:hypothetical protein
MISDPAAASAQAMPRPIPLVDPVTSETRPASGPAATMVFDLTGTFMIWAPDGIVSFRCAAAECAMDFRKTNADWLQHR